MTAFTRVYQRESRRPVAVPLRIALQDALGRVVFEQRLDLTADRFATDRSSDVSLDLPTNRLPEGEYLLTVHAGTHDDAVRSDVRFSVTR